VKRYTGFEEINISEVDEYFNVPVECRNLNEFEFIEDYNYWGPFYFGTEYYTEYQTPANFMQLLAAASVGGISPIGFAGYNLAPRYKDARSKLIYTKLGVTGGIVDPYLVDTYVHLTKKTNF